MEIAKVNGVELEVEVVGGSGEPVLPMPAPCTAVNAGYVLAAGVEAKFLGKEFEIARKAIVDKRWNYQVPQDGRCNVAR